MRVPAPGRKEHSGSAASRRPKLWISKRWQLPAICLVMQHSRLLHGASRTYSALLRSVAHQYFAFNEHSRDRWVALQALRIPADAAILDVGAGTCLYREFFRHCRYLTQDACQLKPRQLRGQSGYGQIDFVSDIVSIPIDSEAVDVVLCTEVLEHVPEPIRAVEEFARVLRPGGRLLLTAPLGSGLHQLPFHYYGGYTPQWYERFLSLYGFEDIDVKPNGGFFEHFGQESQRFAKLLSPRHGRSNLRYWPIWIVSVPLFGWVMPVICAMLSPLDTTHEFTVGYHVSATKATGRKHPK